MHPEMLAGPAAKLLVNFHVSLGERMKLLADGLPSPHQIAIDIENVQILISTQDIQENTQNRPTF
jgi:hypothetical protein